MLIKPVLAKSDTVLKKHIHFSLSKFPKFGCILTFLQHQKIKGMPPARSQRDGRTVWRQELQKSVLDPLEPRLSLQECMWLSSRASRRTAVLKTHLIPRELRLDHEDKVKTLCVVCLDEVKVSFEVRKESPFGYREQAVQWTYMVNMHCLQCGAIKHTFLLLERIWAALGWTQANTENYIKRGETVLNFKYIHEPRKAGTATVVKSDFVSPGLG